MVTAGVRGTPLSRSGEVDREDGLSVSKWTASWWTKVATVWRRKARGARRARGTVRVMCIRGVLVGRLLKADGNRIELQHPNAYKQGFETLTRPPVFLRFLSRSFAMVRPIPARARLLVNTYQVTTRT